MNEDPSYDEAIKQADELKDKEDPNAPKAVNMNNVWHFLEHISHPRVLGRCSPSEDDDDGLCSQKDCPQRS